MGNDPAGQPAIAGGISGCYEDPDPPPAPSYATGFFYLGTCVVMCPRTTVVSLAVSCCEFS